MTRSALGRLSGAALVLLAIYLAAIVVAFRTVPSSNTAQSHFDTLIVLGVPTRPDGSASDEERSRVMEGVREFRAGRADHLILTGGAAHNRFPEAHAMAGVAEQAGVPAGAILEESRAQNTIQNIWYSDALMREHGWTSAEVVSSPSHLPRAALILAHYRMHWRTQAAPWPATYSRCHIAALFWAESTYCLRLRLLGFPPSRFWPERSPPRTPAG